ncbi:ABC-type transport system periplasmic component [Rubidibacter lacunae KORDI 51-2]|uniref:ABC-type transport system periplasmic component n=1 Tax=Rubidibacter lacunae KORDI 51-2 TaxID=582515 RepID=U5DIK0_9CHRO|nr:MlaD family protein [Rubidibacter lacunae]ERN40767.1 ABC-type transport system periplasmic component [Rubidibacter lacunae KORDI 51-2]
MRARTLREGAVGLTMLIGLIAIGGLVVWVRGTRFGVLRYNFTVEFDNANQLVVGAPVYYRGVSVGRIDSIEPQSGTVDVEVIVTSKSLRIPSDVLIQANQSGLIGETSVNIIPQAGLSEALSADATDPLAKDCDSTLVVCDGDRVQGEVGVSIVTLILTAEEALREVAVDTRTVATQISELSSELIELSEKVQGELERAVDAVEGTTGEMTELVQQVGELVENTNGLVADNRDDISRALANLADTSEQVNAAVASVAPTIERFGNELSESDVAQIAEDLEILVSNAREASENIRDVSRTLNDPENVVLLQQTLDSARATFANAQKITADLDELTGSPEFRDNLRRLVEGLSDLVSSAGDLEQHVETARFLGEAEAIARELERLQLELVARDPAVESAADRDSDSTIDPAIDRSERSEQ